MFYILDEREHFYQWDIDRKIVVDDETIQELHFCNGTDNCALIVEVKEEDGKRVAAVPNVLLHKPFRIKVYGYTSNYTKYCEVFDVEPRNMPDDYVYTETEIKRYSDLEERVAALEEGGGSVCECKGRIIINIDVFNHFVSTEGKSLEEIALIPDEELMKYEWIMCGSGSSIGVLRMITCHDGYFIMTFVFNGENKIEEYTFRFDRNTVDCNIIYSRNLNIYDMPQPPSSAERKYLVAVNGAYELVDDIGGDSGSETQQNTILELIEENGVFTNETLPGITPGYLMENVELEQLLTINLAVGSMTNMAMEFYRVSSVSMTDESILFSNGEKLIIWAADGIFSYKDIYADGEEVSY